MKAFFMFSPNLKFAANQKLYHLGIRIRKDIFEL